MAEADGQAGAGTQTTPTGTQTTQAATGSETTGTQTTPQGTAAEETFFDPESIKGKPELEAAYKQMQGAFSKKTAALKASTQKIEAYDSFMSDPVKSVQQVAAQYGYSLTKAEAQQVVGEVTDEPKSWKDVYARAKQEVLQDIMPFLNQVTETRKSQLEKTLDDNCPDWRVYEDKMKANISQHPTLVNDPVMLYRLSVPPEVLEGRAAQAALKKLQDKANSSQLSGGSSTNQQASSKPKGKLTFDQAVQYAKAELAAQGKTSH